MLYIDRSAYINYLKNLLLICSFSNVIKDKYNIVEIVWQEYLICKGVK